MWEILGPQHKTVMEFLTSAVVGGYLLTPVIVENMDCSLYEMWCKNALHTHVPLCLPCEEGRNNLVV
jgi:hypothetical protein